MLVREKPDGKIRICIDPSQTVNKAIRRPVYPMPTIEEKLPFLTSAKFFTVVDVSEAFHNIELDYESSLLTTFKDRTDAIDTSEYRLVSHQVLRNIKEDNMNF